MSRSSVVLPHPLGPRTANSSPRSTASVAGRTARTAPKDFSTPRRTIAASVLMASRGGGARLGVRRDDLALATLLQLRPHQEPEEREQRRDVEHLHDPVAGVRDEEHAPPILVAPRAAGGGRAPGPLLPSARRARSAERHRRAAVPAQVE